MKPAPVLPKKALIDLNTTKVVECLSALAGAAVELISRRTSGRTYYFVLPVNYRNAVGNAPTPFWRAVRTSQSQGVWDTPESAVVSFAAHALEWRSLDDRKDEVSDTLRAMLVGGPRTANDVLLELNCRGVSRDAPTEPLGAWALSAQK